MTRILARIGPKGQTVIPKPVRDELGLSPGDEVYVYTHAGHAHLEPAKGRRAWRQALRSLPQVRLPPGFDIEKEIEASLDEETEKL